MPTIVDFPTIVQDALTVLGEVVDTEAARRPFAESLTGLIVAETKTVSGLTRAFALTTEPACLPRWLTEGHWDVQGRNDKRLAWWQQAPHMQSSPRGVMASAKTRVTPEGKLSEAVGWFWDQAAQRPVRAHAEVISHSGCPAGAHSPSEWRRFQKREACAAAACQDHTLLGMALLDDAIQRGIPGDLTLARYVTSAKLLNHLQRKQRADVGARKLHRKVGYTGREHKRQEGARQMPWEAKQPVRMGSPRYGSCSQQRRIPDVHHPVRIGLLWRERDAQEASNALGRNRLGWEVIRRVLG